jgi:hypothetical protein
VVVDKRDAVTCMDIPCPGGELADSMRDVACTLAAVGVGVGAPQGHAWRECPEECGHDVSKHLMKVAKWMR